VPLKVKGLYVWNGLGVVVPLRVIWLIIDNDDINWLATGVTVPEGSWSEKYTFTGGVLYKKSKKEFESKNYN
jgi:hypothetical protein